MKKTNLVYGFSLAAAFMYSTWIIGYILNPRVAISGTVSELSALSQPHRNFFVATDILMITVILALTIVVLGMARKTWQRMVILLYILFAALTLVTTFVPLECAQSVENCTTGPQSVGHMFAGTFAFVAMFMSLLVLIFYSRLEKLSYVLFALFVWITVAVVNTLFVLLGHTGPVIALTQRLFLLLTAVFIFLIPLILVSTRSNTNSRKRS